MFRTPLLEEPSVAERNVLRPLNPEPRRRLVDPLRASFQFGEVSDGRLVHDAMAFTVVPFSAPLFITERGDQPERAKDIHQSISVGDSGLRFDTVLVGIFTGTGVGQPFVGQGPSAGVVADAENFGARPHLAVGRVVQHIVLKTPRGFYVEPGNLQPQG